MNIVLWIIASGFCTLSIWIMVLNWGVFWQRHILRRTGVSSWIPFLGGIFGIADLVFIPIDALHVWWWVPLLVDWGSLPGMLYSVVWILGKISREK